MAVGEELPCSWQLPEMSSGSEDPTIPTFVVAEFEQVLGADELGVGHVVVVSLCCMKIFRSW